MSSSLKNNPRTKIWVLVDNRIGNANQALALASKLNNSYEVKNITYNQFAKLPNFLLALKPIHVTGSLLNNLGSSNLPKLIISSGRRTAALAVYLKRLSKGKSKIVQIMQPNLDPKYFDLMVLPQHDNYKNSSPKMVRILGALNNIQDYMDDREALLQNYYPELKNFIAVMIGGSNKKAVFTLRNATILKDILKNLYQHHSLPLFITFSRRTPKQVKTVFKEEFLWPHVIYDPQDNLPNPYPAILGAAEYIITTADSISMSSEAASTGKPIYIFCPDNFCLPKHKFFIQQLLDLGIVKKLENNIDFLVKYNYEPLREIDRVAQIVKNHLLDKY